MLLVGRRKDKLLCCCLSVSQLIHLQFPFIFIAEVAYTEMKLGIQICHDNISSVLVTIEQYLIELCPLDLRFLKSVCSFRSFSSHRSPRKGRGGISFSQTTLVYYEFHYIYK